MRLIADIFTRAEVAGESHATTRTDPVTRTPTAAPADTLCVHFTGAGEEHRVWVADHPTASPPAPVLNGLALSWQRGADGVLTGEVAFHGSAIADVLMIGHADGNPTAPHGRRSLRSLGLSRGQASVLAQWTGRPVLVSFSRGVAFSAAHLHEVHAILLASLTRWAATRATCPLPTRAA